MPVVSWIAELLGWIMNGIYELLDMIGMPNIGLAIIFYTIIVYLCMTPLQIKQQKVAKMTSVIQPEITAIQKKYAGRRDSNAQAQMQQETMEVYNKYGVSPMGSCLPLLIQLPLLFALYQVIYHIPGYVAKVADIFTELANKIVAMPNASTVISDLITNNNISNTATSFITAEGGVTFNNTVDFLYLLKPSQWTAMANTPAFADMKSLITTTAQTSQDINSFASINISQSPLDCILGGGSAIVIIAAILVPVLAWFTQWLNYKLMPQQSAGMEAAQGTTKSMSLIMPIFSAFLCCTFSMGIGIYWIAGAVIRCIQQVVINRRIMKMDVDAMIEKAQAKKAKKDAKKNQADSARINTAANAKIRRISNSTTDKIDSEAYYKESQNFRKDSIAAKAGMVRNYEQSKKTKKGGNSKEKK